MKLEGQFDLKALLKEGFNDRNKDHWYEVLDQIETLNMPPEDSLELEESDIAKITSFIEKNYVSSKVSSARALTSYEVMYSLADILKIDLQTFDPFESFHFIKDSDYKYPTIKISDLVSYDYVSQLEESVDLAIEHYIEPRLSIYKEHGSYARLFKKSEYQPVPREPAHSHFVYIDRPQKSELYKDKQIAKNLKGKEREEAVRKAKAIAMAKQKEINKSNFSIDIRKRGLIEIPSCAKNLMPGHYKLTLTAEALNRGKVDPKAPLSKNGGQNKRNKEWEALGYEKARLSIWHYGTIYDNRGWNPVPGVKRAEKVLATHEIDDNVKKEYVFEFTLDNPAVISLQWDNGPYSSRLNRLGLYGKKSTGMRDYSLPYVRIHGEMALKRMDFEVSPHPFKFEKEGTLTEVEGLKRLSSFIEQMGLAHKKESMMKVYHALADSELSFEKKYIETLKWMMLSPEYIYLNPDESEAEFFRHASYSLLKTTPDVNFIEKHQAFNKGKISSNAFATYLIGQPSFKKFLKIFAMAWMEQGVELDHTKFSTTILEQPFNEESVEYLSAVFRDNSPILELYHSDYRVVNKTLTHYYQVGQGKVVGNDFEKVPAKRGGLFSQSAFYIAQSDGVDPLPFKRAQWLVENVFGRSLSEPPNNIDSTQFVETAEAKTFQERAKIHAKHEACASCHQKIDPYAFAMNNYYTDGSLMKKLDVDGEENFIAEMKGSQRLMARSFVKELISYMTGRETTTEDLKVIRGILNQTESQGFRLADMYAGILEAYFKKA